MQLVKQGSKNDYNYKEIFVDTADEIEKINTDVCCRGSVVFVIATGDVYILNSAGSWILQ